MSAPVFRPLTGLIAALLLAPVQSSAQIVKSPLVGKTILRDPVTLAGPAPQNLAIDAQETFGVIAKIVWAPAANAVSYVVKRRLYQDTSCCNLTSPALTTTSWTDTGLYTKGTYIFTVLVNYADGSVGSGEISVAGNGIQNPVMSVQDIGPGRVRLTWNTAIPGTSGALVSGPGLGNGKVVTGGQVDTGLLQPGTLTWTAASIYSQNLGVLSPAGQWSTVTHTVSYGAGRYRISLERFKAISTTPEDPFRNDGNGDEVYITAQVSEYGTNAALVSTRMVRTPTFGDIWNFPNRVRAGTASRNGGIREGDEYPAATEYISQLQPPTLSNLPYLLWEGNLTQINGVVIISPAVWESDEGDDLFPYFATFQSQVAASLPYRTLFQSYVPWTLGNGGVLDTWNPQPNCPLGAQGTPAGTFYPPIQGWRDEPVDMAGSPTYCPTYVAINWAAANSMTTVNPASVVEIPYSSAAGSYKLYLRVEKVPGTGFVVP
jgi:hypothetical protein